MKELSVTSLNARLDGASGPECASIKNNINLWEEQDKETETDEKEVDLKESY